MKIQINHIAKIEGHAGFTAEILKGNVQKAKIDTQDGARLIESILVGRLYKDAPTITSRICGLCRSGRNFRQHLSLPEGLRSGQQCHAEYCGKTLITIKFGPCRSKFQLGSTYNWKLQRRGGRQGRNSSSQCS